MSKRFYVPILLNADPTAALEAATKQYVDGMVPIIWQGTWSASAGYLANDAVQYNGSSYRATTAIVPTATPPPSDGRWQLLAAAGATGPTGPTGATGATGPTGPAGADGAGAGAWTAFSTVMKQGATTITYTNTYSQYMAIGKLVIWNFRLNCTGAGAAAAPVTLTMPITLSTGQGMMGVGRIADSDTPANNATMFLNYSGGIVFSPNGTTGGFWGAVPSVALASGDQVAGTAIYQIP